MKIAYHSLGSVDTGYGDDRATGYPEALTRHLESVSRPSTEIELWGTTHGGIADSYRFFAGIDTYDVLKNFLTIRTMDVDALVLGNIFDPGLREGRELLSIPVVGQLETSAFVATMLADEYGIVSINEKQSRQSLDKLRTYQHTDRLAAIEGMNATISQISTAYTDGQERDTVFDQFTATARTCIDAGAEVLIPGGGILSMLLTEYDVVEVDGVPVVDQIAVTVGMAEMMVGLYEIGAVQTSPVGTFESLDGETIDELCDEYGFDVGDGV